MYMIYETSTTLLPFGEEYFETESAAEQAIAAAEDLDPARLAVADWIVFTNEIEVNVERTNFQTGEKYMESINTPADCSPSSELYWTEV